MKEIKFCYFKNTSQNDIFILCIFKILFVVNFIILFRNLLGKNRLKMSLTLKGYI